MVLMRAKEGGLEDCLFKVGQRVCLRLQYLGHRAIDALLVIALLWSLFRVLWLLGCSIGHGWPNPWVHVRRGPKCLDYEPVFINLGFLLLGDALQQHFPKVLEALEEGKAEEGAFVTCWLEAMKGEQSLGMCRLTWRVAVA